MVASRMATPVQAGPWLRSMISGGLKLSEKSKVSRPTDRPNSLPPIKKCGGLQLSVATAPLTAAGSSGSGWSMNLTATGAPAAVCSMRSTAEPVMRTSWRLGSRTRWRGVVPVSGT